MGRSALIAAMAISGLVPAWAWGADGFINQIGQLASITVPSAADNLAISHLGKLFGGRITGAPVANSSIISEIFQIFNIGVISIVTLLLSYTTTTTILNTAGEGSFMGQKMQNSYFGMMIRLSLGSAALVPAMGGYSMMQVILMSTILQGSLFADMLWQNIVNYSNAGMGLKSIPAGFDVSNAPDYISQFIQGRSTNQMANITTYNTSLETNYNEIVKIYNGLVCYEIRNADVWPRPVFEINKDGESTPTKNGCFDATVDTRYVNEVNATLRVLQSMASNYAIIYNSNTNTYNANTAVIIAEGLAIQAQMLTDLVTSAQALSHANGVTDIKVTNNYGWMNAGAQYSDLEKNANLESDFKLSAFTFQVTPVNGANYGTYELKSESKVSLSPYEKSSIPRSINISEDATQLSDQINSSVNKIFPGNTPSEHQIKNHKANIMLALEPMSSYGPINEDYAYLIKSSIDSWQTRFVNNPQVLFKQPITQIREFGTDLIEYSVLFFEAVTADVFNLAITSGLISYASTGVLSVLQTLAGGIGARISLTGNNMLYSCFGANAPALAGSLPCIMFFIFFIPIFITPIIGAIVSAIGSAISMASVVPSIVTSLLHTMFMISIQNKLAYVSLGAAVAAPLMALGGSIAFYVPYIPVLAYTLATMTWLIAVIEVMVAVPIIMLGVTYPQGHDLLGKAEQAAMLFLSVFLRPPLIVMGYMFSVLTVGVMMIIASVTIHPVMLGLFQQVSGMPHTSDITVIVFILMTMIVYAILLLNSVDYAFGFIFKLPSTVMKWIGLPTVEAQEEQYMQEIRQGSAGTASELANAPGGMTAGIQEKAVNMQKRGG